MRKMNEYERHAYLYSAWSALLVPCLLTIWITWSILPSELDTFHMIQKTLGIVASSAVVYAALGFYIRELFRSTSKMIFQFPMFKENETRMPTTELLLWKNKLLSRSQIEQLHHKLQAQYDYLMLDEQQEYADELEARRNIVGAVGIMKEATRGNKMLLQCNYRYGYQRNLLGGLVWSFMIVLLLLIASYVYNLKYMAGCWLALIFVLIQGVVAFFIMKYAARNYARTLIITFISK